jgi:oligopeptide/dipeptide ABC transporter ATP-binding protein
MKSPLLEVDDLHLTIFNGTNAIHLLQGISFAIYPGEIVALVGESGCGKSLTASAILGLLAPSHTIKGSIFFEGHDLLAKTNRPHPRGTRLSLILQDPSLALNPLIPIGGQLIEGLCYHKKISRHEAFKIGIQWLTRVGIGDACDRMHQYPHEISGGMKQRVLIAMALICQPSLLIADEPTTALDVTIQAQIIDLLKILQKEEGMSILLITHDLGVAASSCQRMMVMYAGRLVEIGSIAEIFTSPQHPYTQALLQSQRSLGNSRDQPLISLEGIPPQPHNNLLGCSFASRCPFALRICREYDPPHKNMSQGSVQCWLPQIP